VAVIGLGATGIQLVQELSRDAKKLDVYMRNTSYCLPIGQRQIDEQGQAFFRDFYKLIFQGARHSISGFASNPQACGISSVSVEKREALFEELWQKGGFNYLAQNYNDFSGGP